MAPKRQVDVGTYVCAYGFKQKASQDAAMEALREKKIESVMHDDDRRLKLSGVQSIKDLETVVEQLFGVRDSVFYPSTICVFAIAIDVSQGALKSKSQMICMKKIDQAHFLSDQRDTLTTSFSSLHCVILAATSKVPVDLYRTVWLCLSARVGSLQYDFAAFKESEVASDNVPLNGVVTSWKHGKATLAMIGKSFREAHPTRSLPGIPNPAGVAKKEWLTSYMKSCLTDQHVKDPTNAKVAFHTQIPNDPKHDFEDACDRFSSIMPRGTPVMPDGIVSNRQWCWCLQLPAGTSLEQPDNNHLLVYDDSNDNEVGHFALVLTNNRFVDKDATPCRIVSKTPFVYDGQAVDHLWRFEIYGGGGADDGSPKPPLVKMHCMQVLGAGLLQDDSCFRDDVYPQFHVIFYALAELERWVIHNGQDHEKRISTDLILRCFDRYSIGNNPELSIDELDAIIATVASSFPNEVSTSFRQSMSDVFVSDTIQMNPAASGPATAKDEVSGDTAEAALSALSPAEEGTQQPQKDTRRHSKKRQARRASTAALPERQGGAKPPERAAATGALDTLAREVADAAAQVSSRAAALADPGERPKLSCFVLNLDNVQHRASRLETLADSFIVQQYGLMFLQGVSISDTRILAKLFGRKQSSTELEALVHRRQKQKTATIIVASSRRFHVKMSEAKEQKTVSPSYIWVLDREPITTEGEEYLGLFAGSAMLAPTCAFVAAVIAFKNDVELRVRDVTRKKNRTAASASRPKVTFRILLLGDGNIEDYTKVMNTLREVFDSSTPLWLSSPSSQDADSVEEWSGRMPAKLRGQYGSLYLEGVVTGRKQKIQYRSMWSPGTRWSVEPLLINSRYEPFLLTIE